MMVATILVGMLLFLLPYLGTIATSGERTVSGKAVERLAALAARGWTSGCRTKSAASAPGAIVRSGIDQHARAALARERLQACREVRRAADRTPDRAVRRLDVADERDAGGDADADAQARRIGGHAAELRHGLHEFLAARTAFASFSGSGRGAPNTAIMPSPLNSTTTPPQPVDDRAHAFRCSGSPSRRCPSPSRPSANAV